MGKIISEKTNRSKNGTIGGIIFLIWFVGSIIAAIYFSQVNKYYSTMIIGQCFLVYGMIHFLFKMKRKIIGVLFSLIGLACIIIPYLMIQTAIKGIIINWESIIILLSAIIFVLFGLSFMLITIMEIRQLQKRCNMEVVANVVEHKVIYSDSGNKLFCPIYEFQFNGKKYTVNNGLYTNRDINPIGTLVNLKINPDNPEEFID